MKPIFLIAWILVLSLIQSCNANAQNTANNQQQAVASKEKPARVVLYDEDPDDPKGKQYVGNVVWRTEQVKSNDGHSDGLAVRADIDIPNRHLKMSMLFRNNTDVSLPASHTVELTFVLPPGFDNGTITNVPGILMKSNEQARGTPLAGLAVKIRDGSFLIGLSNVKADRSRNLQLLTDRSWFDVPLVYSNKRRAIIAIEKGSSGERAFAQAAITSRLAENAKTTEKAIAPTTSAPEQRTEPIDALVELWNDANDRCRGGAGDSPKTLAACEERERIGTKLTRLGHCHGKNDQVSADMRWHKCGGDSVSTKDNSQAGHVVRSNEVVSAPTPAQSEPSANGQQHLSSKASIDCAKVATQSNNPVAHILCSGIDGAAADWDLNSTLWAVIGSKNDIQKKTFDQDQQTWRDSLNTRCSLQKNVSAFTEDQKKCVLEAVHKRATILRASLSGDVLAESRRTPEQHADIQKSLIDRGLMKGSPSGEFDANTRQAIKEFQKATGSAQTGFLSAEQVAQLRQNTPSSATGKDGTDVSSLTQAELDPLRARLTKLWNVPPGQGHPEELIVDVHIHLGRDRKLSAAPEIASRGSSPRYKAAADAAVRAVIQGQPYDMLKDETYDQWKDMIVTFDPRQFFGSSVVTSNSIRTGSNQPASAPSLPSQLDARIGTTARTAAGGAEISSQSSSASQKSYSKKKIIEIYQFYLTLKGCEAKFDGAVTLDELRKQLKAFDAKIRTQGLNPDQLFEEAKRSPIDDEELRYTFAIVNTGLNTLPLMSPHERNQHLSLCQKLTALLVAALKTETTSPQDVKKQTEQLLRKDF